MKLPARHQKFIKALTGFAITNLILRIVYALVFWNFLYDGLLVYSLFSVCVWIVVIILCINRQPQPALTIALVELTVFSYAATISAGLGGSFFLLLLAAIPLNFYNTSSKKRTRSIGGFLLVLAIIVLFGLMQSDYFYLPYDDFESTIFSAINLVSVAVMLSVSGHQYGLVNSNEEKEILLSNQRMMVMANTDPLTNLINRRIMMTRIEQEKERVDQGAKPFTLIMVDVDNFKQINDEYGHDGGDFVLVNLAHLINLCLRKSDIVSRWGGDEFLVILPETPLLSGQMVAEKIKNRITTSPFIFQERDIAVSVTLGVAQCDHFVGVGSSIRKADQALYIGKHEGKDRVVLSP
jgi:diguanylate cyclase (GGDEF)-like protein